ncbi:MAG: TetR/AcrR family transcriptional regulator [Anaerolineae bacterium]|nr:TetR/AcrR family transcriptional regulator [Anaerolineae bacterium]
MAARRGQILEAAAQVFAKKGFQRSTIKDIAQTAGIADGTIYLYFKHKDDLLLGLLDRLTQAGEQARQFEQVGETDIESWLRSYLSQQFMVMKLPQIEAFRVIIAEMLTNETFRERAFAQIFQPTFDAIEAQLRQWSAAGLLPAADWELVMRVHSGSVLGLITYVLIGDKRLAERWQDLPELLTRLLLDGINGVMGTEGRDG